MGSTQSRNKKRRLIKASGFVPAAPHCMNGATCTNQSSEVNLALNKSLAWLNPETAETFVTAWDSLPAAELGQEVVWKQGRRCFTFFPYLLPLDPREMDRADLLHFLLNQLTGDRLCLHDLNSASGLKKRILDVGCGNGRWLRDMARSFPLAMFTGLDLVDDLFIQPSLPSNIQFIKTNILSLPLKCLDKTASFDYIHQRFLALGVPYFKWAPLLSEYHRLLAPGGRLEIVEFDYRIYPQPLPPNLLKLQSWLHSIALATNINLSLLEDMTQLTKKAGFFIERESETMVSFGGSPSCSPGGSSGGGMGGLAGKMLWMFFEGIYIRAGEALINSEEYFATLKDALTMECSKQEFHLFVKHWVMVKRQ